MPVHPEPQTSIDPVALLERVRAWAKELGFSQIGVAGVDLSSAEAGLSQWLAQGFHDNIGLWNGFQHFSRGGKFAELQAKKCHAVLVHGMRYSHE